MNGLVSLFGKLLAYEPSVIRWVSQNLWVPLVGVWVGGALLLLISFTAMGNAPSLHFFFAFLVLVIVPPLAAHPSILVRIPLYSFVVGVPLKGRAVDLAVEGTKLYASIVMLTMWGVISILCVNGLLALVPEPADGSNVQYWILALFILLFFLQGRTFPLKRIVNLGIISLMIYNGWSYLPQELNSPLEWLAELETQTGTNFATEKKREIDANQQDNLVYELSLMEIESCRNGKTRQQVLELAKSDPAQRQALLECERYIEERTHELNHGISQRVPKKVIFDPNLTKRVKLAGGTIDCFEDSIRIEVAYVPTVSGCTGVDDKVFDINYNPAARRFVESLPVADCEDFIDPETGRQKVRCNGIGGLWLQAPDGQKVLWYENITLPGDYVVAGINLGNVGKPAVLSGVFRLSSS